ncbi:MAG TPA: LamB/YcsF family protein, partial [Candidatus Eremiobacteraceae bacterium]|nr:LamB/YcsF family protein [Candidatus Eremiobacteraceae bacterium]
MNQARRVDLNADVGESFGARRFGDDEPIFRYVTSANIACGIHAGDPGVIAATVKAAASHKVAVGAHPSYPDQSGFGRQTIEISADELRHVL